MRSFSLAAAAIALAAFLAASGTAVPGDVTEIEKGSLIEKVRGHAAEQFKQNSNRFRVPSGSEKKEWDRLVRLAARGRVSEAAALLRRLGYPYSVKRFLEESNGKEYVLLEEEPKMYGWGLFVFDPRSKGPLVIEVPHPVSDSGTEIEGAEAFVETGARALLLSGVHRQANRTISRCTHATEESDYRESDPAHAVDTMFHQTHETLVEMFSDAVAIQLHGMRERDVCPNVFLSTGTASVTPNAERLLACLKDSGVEASLYDGTVSCPLIASTNVQGRFSNGERGDPCNTYAETSPSPGFFIHAEQEPSIRKGPAEWKPVIAALKCAFPSSSGRKQR